MRRIVHLLLPATLVAALAACSGGDDASSATTAPAAPVLTTTTIPVVTDSARCEGAPDPADYQDATVAIRPCEIPTELVVQTIRPGNGPAATAEDSLVYHYSRIRSADGSLIDSSYATGLPQTIPVIGQGGQVAGLDTGLVGAQTGAVIRLDIPADQAYGDTPPPDASAIQAGDVLTYVVDVLAVIPNFSPEDAPTDLTIDPSVGATEVTTVDLIEGDGATAELGRFVVLNMLLVRGDNSVILYNSWEQGTPLVVLLDPALMEGPEPVTLPGIFEGVQGAKVGGRRVISMPPDKAWGVDGQPQLGLPRNTDLQVILEVIAVY